MPSTTVSSAGRVISFKKVPEQWSFSKVPLWKDGLVVLYFDLLSLYNLVIGYHVPPRFIPGQRRTNGSL